MFFLYAALTGAVFSVLLDAYTTESVIGAFGGACGVFAGMAMIGYTTNADLSRFGPVLFGALIGIIAASFVYIFVGGHALNLIIGYLGVIIFSGLTAYDMQMLKRLRSGQPMNARFGGLGRAVAAAERWRSPTARERREARDLRRALALPRLHQPVHLAAADLRQPALSAAARRSARADPPNRDERSPGSRRTARRRWRTRSARTTSARPRARRGGAYRRERVAGVDHQVTGRPSRSRASRPRPVRERHARAAVAVALQIQKQSSSTTLADRRGARGSRRRCPRPAPSARGSRARRGVSTDRAGSLQRAVVDRSRPSVEVGVKADAVGTGARAEVVGARRDREPAVAQLVGRSARPS